MTAPVAVAVVTWNSAAQLPSCMAAIANLEPAPAEVVVVDNASCDGSAELAARLLDQFGAKTAGSLVREATNRGWSGGMNRAISATSAPFVLALNPDAAPAPDFLARLLAWQEVPGLSIGAWTGRLVRPGTPVVLDACGMQLTRSFRHLDRGSGEPDRGQYDQVERVFGATGAAALLRRAALDDVRLGSEEWIDESFHSYREDAELCFRLRERGFEVLYVPDARCEHRRAVTPASRRQASATVNRGSLRNRYLLRLAHQSGANLLRTLPLTLARDVAALLWVLGCERSSLGAYADLWRQRRHFLARARAVRARRLVSVDGWFGCSGLPLPGPAPRL